MSQKEETKAGFALGKTNYMLLCVGVAIITLGFALMVHSPSEDPNVFDESIYGFRCTTLAPMVVLAGFIFEIYAIMKRPCKSQTVK